MIDLVSMFIVIMLLLVVLGITLTYTLPIIFRGIESILNIPRDIIERYLEK